MIYKCDACLKVYSDVLRVEEISQRLAAQPNRAIRKGERMSARNPKSQVHPASAWMRTEMSESENSAEECVGRICDFIEDKRTELATLNECGIELLIGIFSDSWQTNFILPAASMRRLALVELDLLFSFYGPDE